MNDTLLNLVIIGIVALLLAVIVAFFRYLRSTPDRESLELWAIQLVRAAEQMFPGDNATKLTYCMDLIERVYPRIDTDLLRSVIEYAVFRLRDETDAGTTT